MIVSINMRKFNTLNYMKKREIIFIVIGILLFWGVLGLMSGSGFGFTIIANIIIVVVLWLIHTIIKTINKK